MKISQVLVHLKEFINKDKIQELKVAFENLNQDVQSYYGGEIYACEWDNEGSFWHVEYSKNNEYYKVDEMLETYVKTYFQHYLGLIEDELIIQYLNLKKSEFEDLLSKLDLEMSALLKKSNIPNTLSGMLSEFRSSITNKYLNKKLGEGADTAPYIHKIKWLGNLNTLSTFLLDYSSPKNNLGKAMMEHDIQAFKSLMMNCFVEKQGNAISKATVDTYFDTGKKADKRAKKEVIELQLEKLEEKSYERAEPSPKG